MDDGRFLVPAAAVEAVAAVLAIGAAGVAEASRRGVVNLVDEDDGDALTAAADAAGDADVGETRDATGRDDDGAVVGSDVGRVVGEVGVKENDTRGVDAAEDTTDKEPDDERKMGRITVAGATAGGVADAEVGVVTGGEGTTGLVMDVVVAVVTVGDATSFGVADEGVGNNDAAAAAARRVSRRLADTLRPNAGPRGGPVEGGVTVLRALPLVACPADSGVPMLIRSVEEGAAGTADADGGVVFTALTVPVGMGTVGVGRDGDTVTDGAGKAGDDAAAVAAADTGLGLTRPDEPSAALADRPRCIMGEGVESVDEALWALAPRDDEMDLATGRERTGARAESLSSVVVLRGSEEDDDE